MDRPPLPPFTLESAARKVRLAEDAWNSRDPARVAQAYTVDSRWRNRSEFLQGRDAIAALLERKWQREREYRLVKELWAHCEYRIASINDRPIRDDERLFHWALGRRPDTQLSLSTLGL